MELIGYVIVHPLLIGGYKTAVVVQVQLLLS